MFSACRLLPVDACRLLPAGCCLQSDAPTPTSCTRPAGRPPTYPLTSRDCLLVSSRPTPTSPRRSGCRTSVRVTTTTPPPPPPPTTTYRRAAVTTTTTTTIITSHLPPPPPAPLSYPYLCKGPYMQRRHLSPPVRSPYLQLARWCWQGWHWHRYTAHPCSSLHVPPPISTILSGMALECTARRPRTHHYTAHP